MGISMLVPLSIGNAVKVLLDPPAGALATRVLRTTSGGFAGAADPSAVKVYQGDGNYCVDVSGLLNGTSYTYGDFYTLDGKSWMAGSVASVTPAAAYEDQSADVLSLLRDRLDVGLQNEIAMGSLFPECGEIEVLNAPPSFDGTAWPVVTVHVVNDGSAERSLGEQLDADSFDAINGGVWDETHGWIARAHLTVIGWSKNPDERIALRKVLRRLVIGNLPVFQGCGITRIDFNQTDHEEMESFAVPVYQTIGQFTCFAPAVVATSAGSITDVSVSVDPTFPDGSAAVDF